MIRRDLFAVKADERDGAGMGYVFMSRSRKAAFDKALEIVNNHSLGIIRLAKVVHPAQWVVDVFAMHNPIHSVWGSETPSKDGSPVY